MKQARSFPLTNCASLIAIIALAFALSTQPSVAQKKSHDVQDVITQQATAVPLTGVPAESIVLTDKVNWSAIYDNWKFSTISNVPACVNKTPDVDEAYIFHIAHWAVGTPPRLISSSWSAYGTELRDHNTLKRRLSAAGDPLVYGKKKALIIGIDVFDGKSGSSSLSVSYKTSATQDKPENVQNLSQLVTALLGLTTSAAKESAPILIAFSCQAGTDHLPFDLNVVETIGLPQANTDTDSSQPSGANPSTSVPPALPAGVTPSASLRMKQQPSSSLTSTAHLSQVSLSRESNTPIFPLVQAEQTKSGGKPAKTNSDAPTGSNSDATTANAKGSTSTPVPAGGQVDCSSLSAKSTCTISRTFTSLDKEWWDVSLAVTIPGVRETQFTISNASLVAKPTTHTDAYAMFDVYPGAYWLTKDSALPHFAVGVPVASKSLYRPFFGISEDLTGWTKLESHGFPIKMSFFAGIVYMKTTSVAGSPTTAAQLTSDSTTRRVIKPLFGIEVPVSALISKVGKSTSSKNTSSSTSNKSATTTPPSN